MINHTRTLLLNLAPLSYVQAGEVYVPSDYRPVALPNTLEAARALLFGLGADRYGRQRTLDRLFAAIDSQPVLKLLSREADSRVALPLPAPVPAAESLGPAPGSSVRVPPDPFLAAGRGYGSWTITVDGADVALVEQANADGVSVPATAVAAGWAVGLPGSRAVAVLPSNGVWLVSVWAQPRHSFVALADVDPASVFQPEDGGVEAQLFVLWRDSPMAWERAAAAAVALARRIDELR